MTYVPVIDISTLINDSDKSSVAKRIGDACQEYGFFYIINHGIDENLQIELEKYTKEFFSLELIKKLDLKKLSEDSEIGYVPYKKSKLEAKENIKFGDDSRSHITGYGENRFPEEIPQYGPCIIKYMAALRNLAYKILGAIALSLNLEENYIYEKYEPDQLLRVINYPILSDEFKNNELIWGIREHCDYGFLTILKQDDVGGLEIQLKNLEWIEAKPIPNAYICNIGDMLDKMTGGRYCSTPHR